MKLGSGDIQFQGCPLKPATAICLCFHRPPHVPDRDKVLAYLSRSGIELDGDFSLVLDADGNEDVILFFGNSKTLETFQLLVNTLTEMNGGAAKVESEAEIRAWYSPTNKAVSAFPGGSYTVPLYETPPVAAKVGLSEKQNTLAERIGYQRGAAEMKERAADICEAGATLAEPPAGAPEIASVLHKAAAILALSPDLHR